MLRLRSLNKAYREPVLKDLSLDLPDTGLILLRGASGSGKTTLLRILAGLETPDSGGIDYPEDVKISMVFQEARLLPFSTVAENLLLVCPGKTREEAVAALAEFGVEDAADLYPDALSGGMKERVNLARSCFYGGTLYLWDEPTKELDAANAARVIAKMKELSEKALVIAATHDDAVTGDRTVSL